MSEKNDISLGRTAGLILCAMLMLAGIADLAGAFRATAASGAFALMGGAAAAEVLFFFLRKKWDISLLRSAGKLLVIAVLLELTVFQYPSYRMMFSDAPELTLLENAEGEGFHGSDKTALPLTFPSLDVPAETVWVDIEWDNEYTKAVDFTADISDQSCAEPRLKLVGTEIVRGCGQSQYAIIQASGNVNFLRLNFTGRDYGDSFRIRGVVLNRPVPFDVSPLRVLLILLGGMLLHGLMFSVRMSRPFEEEQRLCGRMCAVVTGAAVVLVSMMCLSLVPEKTLWEAFRRNEGDQMTEEMVLAAEDGRTYLYVLGADDPLLQMENPYDWSIRSADNILYSWDHVLYKGKYYSYYGVAPLLLLVPYHLVTGHFFPAETAVLLFSAAGAVLLAMCYLAVIRRWFRRAPAGNVLAGLIVLLAGCGIWFCTGRPKFYEIAITSGFCCVAGGALLLVSSDIIGSGKLRPLRLAGGSLLLGMAVLCRPTLAVYAVCGGVWVLWGAFSRKKDRLPALLWGLLPLIAAAAFQMWYNYVRFDNVLEFGIKYSLTVNDFTHTRFHLHFALISLYNFLLAPPAFIPDYPYITAPFSMIGVNGYYFKDFGTASGLLFRALPVFGLLLCGRALRTVPERKERLKWALLGGLPCVVMPMAIIFSTWESGYAVRYLPDFSWLMIMGGVFCLFRLEQFSGDRAEKLFLRYGLAVSALAAVIVNGVQAYAFAFRSDVYPLEAYSLRRLMEFWI